MENAKFDANNSTETGKYDHKRVETQWRELWEKLELYKTPEIEQGDKKKYILETFPYPSGYAMHVGHAKGYVASDITARYYRMTSHKVLYPMGWDAFGLPAENYAIKTGTHPRQNTDSVIDTSKLQLTKIGLSYGWDRELGTHNPEYYRWTQWLFELMYKRGLAYKKEALVNWDPVDQTVLANEQVLADGTAERSGAKVEQRLLNQWFFKITDYAERLLDGLENLDWPESTKLMQKNWIGKSQGANIQFEVATNKNFVILHGANGNLDGEFIPWLTNLLKESGHRVQVPSYKQFVEDENFDNVVDFLLDELDFDENTVIIGRSLGGVVGLKLIEKLPEHISGIILAGSCLFEDNAGQYNFPSLDLQQIKEKTKFRTCLASSTDTKIPNTLTKELALIIDATYKVVNAEDHFRGKKELSILNEVLETITVFTTRPDTIFGATYLVLAPEHQLVKHITTAEQLADIQDYQEKTSHKSQLQRTDLNKDKSGIWTGTFAINPANGQQIPIFIADYVLSTYGTGAIMAVPAHDQRDMEFAIEVNRKANSPQIEFPQVVAPEFGQNRENEEFADGGCGVIFDPQTKLFAHAKLQLDHDQKYIYFAGGVNPGEDMRDAVLREVEEESGLHDFVSFTPLATAFAHYRNTMKNKNRFARANAYLGILKSNDTHLTKLEAHEKMELTWSSYEDLLANFQENNVDEGLSHYIFFLKKAAFELTQKGLLETKTKLESEAFGDYGIVMNSGQFDNLKSEEAKAKIIDWLATKGNAEAKTTYRLRDWLVSRQRYWGAPIPIVYRPSQDVLFESIGHKEGFPTTQRDVAFGLIYNPKLDKYLVTEYIGTSQTDDYYHLVGGGIEAGEQPSEALKREIVEETGIPIDHFKLFEYLGKVNRTFYTDKTNSNKSYLATIYYIETESEQEGFLEGERKTVWKTKDQFSQHTVEHFEWIIKHYEKIRQDNLENSNFEVTLIPESHLPVILPDDVKFKPTGRSPLYDHEEFHASAEKLYGPGTRRESDTMDTFVDSSWYFFRYCSPHNDLAFADKNEMKKWMPVDQYIIGAEHSNLHLLYARFFTKVLFDAGLIDFYEPFLKVRHQGLIQGEDSRKMSKRWGNVVNPDDINIEMGADTLRMYEMFMGPFKDGLPWSTTTIKGVRRFIDRVWKMQHLVTPRQDKNAESFKTIETALHKLIKKVSEDIEKFSFNTSVAEYMKFANIIEENGIVEQSQWKRFLLVLAPFAPFITEELWKNINKIEKNTKQSSIHSQSWPTYDEAMLESETITVGVQINGKRRAEATISPKANETEVRQIVLEIPEVQKWVENNEIRKFIYVPGKIINIVV